MACDCKNIKVSWSEGNNVLVLFRLYEGNPKAEFTVDGFDSWSLEVLRDGVVNVQGLERALDEENHIVVKFPDTMVAGNYTIVIKLSKNDFNRRVTLCGIIEVVNCDQKANVPFGVIDAGTDAEIDVTFQIVPSVWAQGANQYEIWKQAHPDGTLQEYIDIISAATTTWDNVTDKPIKRAAFSAIEVTGQEGEITDPTTIAAVAALKNSGIALGDLVLLNYDNYNTTSAIVATVSNVNPLRMTFFCREKLVILTEAPANTYKTRIINIDNIPQKMEVVEVGNVFTAEDGKYYNVTTSSEYYQVILPYAANEMLSFKIFVTPNDEGIPIDFVSPDNQTILYQEISGIATGEGYSYELEITWNKSYWTVNGVGFPHIH